MDFLTGEERYDLGDLHVRAVCLPGHSKGSVGLLIEEERLLLAGDAFNGDTWMFALNHDTLDTLAHTLLSVKELPADTFLSAHNEEELPLSFVDVILENLRNRQVDWSSYETILGSGTYLMTWSAPEGTSRIRISVEDAVRCREEQGRGFDTVLLHGREAPHRERAHGTIHTPIYQSSAFSYDTAEEMSDVFAHRRLGFSYTRISNPTITAFEQKITELEGGVASVACASGMAAVTYALLNVLECGDEFITSAGLYGGTINLFNSLHRFGITPRYVQPNDIDGLLAAVNDRTKLVFAETLSNPGLTVTDIAATAQAAHSCGLPLLVDNTMASPWLMRPLEYGADVVINSASKYINGTGNGISGVVTDGGAFDWSAPRFSAMKPFLPRGNLCYISRLRSEMLTNHGGCLSPQNAFLNLLGLETMGIRMERECANAETLARHLSRLPGITVNYPGLPGCPGHELAASTMRGYGSVLTLRVGDESRAMAFMNALHLPYIISNVGDIRTMVVHPASTMALHSTAEEQIAAGVYPDLIRVSVGIENAEDLIADFDRALLETDLLR